MSLGCNSDDEDNDLSLRKQCIALASIFTLFIDSNPENAYTADCIFSSIYKVRVVTDLPLSDLKDLKAALHNTRLRKVLKEMCKPYVIDYPEDYTGASLDGDQSVSRKISFPIGPSLTSTDSSKRSRRGESISIVSRQELACHMCGLGNHIIPNFNY
jgi:hypothetical protein